MRLLLKRSYPLFDCFNIQSMQNEVLIWVCNRNVNIGIVRIDKAVINLRQPVYPCCESPNLIMEERTLYCRKCKKPFGYRVQRHYLVKKIFFFLPLRRYFCDVCFRKRYVWVKAGSRHLQK